jgi:hypothetical protein
MMSSKSQNLSIGFVAWMDVLGYKQVLSSDQGTAPTEEKVEVWGKVFDVLRKAREQQFDHELTEYLKKDRGLCEALYRSTAFTDSIVTSVDLSEVDDFGQWALETLFLRRTAFLSRLLFEEGLPIRAGIAYGHFVHSEAGFAGSPFIEAEALSSRLELSACVFSDAAIAEVRRIHRNRPPWDRLDANSVWFRYDQCALKPKPVASVCGVLANAANPACPLAMAPVYEPMYVLNFASRGGLRATNDASEFKIDFSRVDADLKTIVTRSFSAHGKPVQKASIQAKIQETVKMLEAAHKACPSFFS